jgi:hypothetical protein
MKSPIRSLHPMRLILRQQTYIAVAVAIYAALRAADRPVPIGSTLIYTLSLCNLIVLMQDHLGFLYNRKSLLHSWTLYLPLLLVVSLLGVMVVNMIQFPVVEESPGCTVVLQSHIGGNRVVDMLSGEQLPRIC